MNGRGLLFSLLSFLVVPFADAINFSRVNVAWQYDENAEIKVAHRVIRADDGISVFLQVIGDSLSSWTFDYIIQEGYESEGHREFQPLAIDTLLDVKGQVMVKMKIGQPTENLLVLKVSQGARLYYYDISLRIGTLSFPSIYPMNENGLPILQSYINRSGFSWIGNGSFLAMQYMEEFPIADPPMADMKPLAPQVNMDTSFVFINTVSFEINHFYVVQKDSLSTVGTTMLRTAPYFPEFRQLKELVESMLYITSEQERKSLLNSKNLKQSFDSFWMNTYSTKSRARNAIRVYYGMVERANRIFTDFKPGWKTDRGMMSIVYGIPDEVYRTANSEEWYYDDGAAFEFTIISTFFAAKTYSLRRSRSFEEEWYSRIASIRQGINE